MKFVRILLALTTLLFSVSAASAYTEEQLRSGLKLFLKLQGHECGYIVNVDMREEPRAFNILCAESEGSEEEIMYFFQFVGAGAVVEVIDKP